MGGGGFVLGVTAGGLSDAFLLGAAGAVAVATVSALIGGIRWLLSLDTRLATIRDEIGDIGIRVAAVELELTSNGGGSLTTGGTVRDAVERIDRRSRKVAESVGAVDYDDEDEGSDEVTGHGAGIIGPPAPL